MPHSVLRPGGGVANSAALHTVWGSSAPRLTLTNWHLGPQRKARHPVLSTLPTPRQATTQRSGVRAKMTSEALGLGARAQNPTPECPCSGFLTRPQASLGE